MVHLYEASRLFKCIETESKMVVARGRGDEENGGVVFLAGTEFQFCKVQKSWGWMTQQVNIFHNAELYSKMVTMVNFMLCAFHHN